MATGALRHHTLGHRADVMDVQLSLGGIEVGAKGAYDGLGLHTTPPPVSPTFGECRLSSVG